MNRRKFKWKVLGIVKGSILKGDKAKVTKEENKKGDTKKSR